MIAFVEHNLTISIIKYSGGKININFIVLFTKNKIKKKKHFIRVEGVLKFVFVIID